MQEPELLPRVTYMSFCYFGLITFLSFGGSRSISIKGKPWIIRMVKPMTGMSKRYCLECHLPILSSFVRLLLLVSP